MNYLRTVFPTRNEASARTVLRRAYLSAAFLIGTVPLLEGCGGTTDADTSIPQVAGTYSITESVTAATCSPNQLPAGGIVRLDAFSQTFDVQISQTGSTIRLFEFGNPEPTDEGTINTDGRISFSGHQVFQETPRERNRVFFVYLTIVRELQVQSAERITGSASYVNVFHEGSTTSAVYTTCSRQGGNELIRK
jgi:hypothetical protein